MELYMSKYDSFNNKIVYDFRLGDGGIGDCIKFFMFILTSCMKNNTKLYYLKNNIEIEKYIKLRYDKMYIDETQAKELELVTFVKPQTYYFKNNYDWSIKINDVFYFTDEIQINSRVLFPLDISNYISIHLRLGDKYLETEKKYVICKEDARIFSEEKIYKFIEENSDKNIFFCCDNNEYKLKIKEKYNNIIITNCDIGHTSFSNTTTKQILDGITEFYILTKSEMIYTVSNNNQSDYSGFSLIASKFNNIPLIN